MLADAVDGYGRLWQNIIQPEPTNHLYDNCCSVECRVSSVEPDNYIPSNDLKYFSSVVTEIERAAQLQR